MEIIRHPKTTRDIGAPSDMQDGSCESLPVIDVQTEHGIFVCSYWLPNAEELAALNAGGAVQLGVRAAGRQHPVVSMMVTKEPV